MREKYKSLPPVIRGEVMRRCLWGCALLLITMLLAAMGNDALLILPGALFGLWCVFNGGWLFYRADRGQVLQIEGTVAQLRLMRLRKRPRVITLETNAGKPLHIRLRESIRLDAGQRVCVYLDTGTRLYERNGAYWVFQYIAMEERMPPKRRIRAEGLTGSETV